MVLPHELTNEFIEARPFIVCVCVCVCACMGRLYRSFSITTVICILILYTDSSINSLAPHLCRGSPIENKWSSDLPLAHLP